MRICPICGEKYNGDNYGINIQFCLADGATLIDANRSPADRTKNRAKADRNKLLARIFLWTYSAMFLVTMGSCVGCISEYKGGDSRTDYYKDSAGQLKKLPTTEFPIENVTLVLSELQHSELG